MASNEESDAVTMDKIESLIEEVSAKFFEQMKTRMDQRFEEIKEEIKAINAKLDGNTIEMNERFAAVEERFVKSKAIMDSTKEQIGLVENNLNVKITSVKDEVSVNIERQISAARAEFQEVITVTNDRVTSLSETIDKRLVDMKAFSNLKILENEVKTDNVNKSVATQA